MKVPLRVDEKASSQREYFEVWYDDDKHKTVKSPVYPYFYSKKPLEFRNSVRSETTAKALSDLQETLFYRHKFRTRKELVQARNDDTFEDNIPFVLRNRIDVPDFFYQFKQTELRFLFFDIEQETTNGIFPTYDDRITSIAWATNDRKVKSIYLNKDRLSDKTLIELFIEQYQKIKPHIIVVYNKDYDIPTLLRRCEKNNISTVKLSKTKKKPYFGGKEDYHIDGTVIYDVAQSAFKDQSLNGEVENRGLKEVSNHFGFKEKRAPLTPKQMNEYIGTKTLARYNMDDVRRLMLVFNVYWPNIEFNANDLGIPLNFAVEMNTSNLALITLGDEFKKQHIISDGSNAQRYPEIFQRKKKTGEKNYEGALVDIENTGTVRPCKKADYSSLYPTIMAEFNLSPDTTTLITYEKYRNKFEIAEHDDYFLYAVPDKEMKKTLIIKVLKKRGFAANLVKKNLDERSIYKQRYKKTGNLRDKALSSNRKVKANGGIYGIQGSAHHPFGFAPIAVTTTAIGREVMKILLSVIRDFYGNVIYDVDTDGVYFTCNPKEFNKNRIRTELAKRLEERFHKKVNLSIDFDEYKAGYFYKAKNYVLLTLDDKIIFHGNTMKSSSKNILSRELIFQLAKAKLFDKPTKPIVDQFISLDFPLKHFAMNVRMGKHLHQYKNDSILVKRLALIAKEELGLTPEQGNIYHYVKTNDGYQLYQLAKKEDIDRKYYLQQIDTILEVFNETPQQQSLEEWL